MLIPFLAPLLTGFSSDIRTRQELRLLHAIFVIIYHEVISQFTQVNYNHLTSAVHASYIVPEPSGPLEILHEAKLLHETSAETSQTDVLQQTHIVAINKKLREGFQYIKSKG